MLVNHCPQVGINVTYANFDHIGLCTTFDVRKFLDPALALLEPKSSKPTSIPLMACPDTLYINFQDPK